MIEKSLFILLLTGFGEELVSVKTFHDYIDILEPDDIRWREFIEHNEKATIFHHPAWIRFISDCYHHYPFIICVLDPNGNIHAGAPMVEVNSLLSGHRWVSLPFTDHCSPLYDDPHWLVYLIDYFLETIGKRSVPKIELRWEYPIVPDSYKTEQYVLSRLELCPQSELIAKRIDHKYRRMPRIAQERGAYCRQGMSLDDMHIFYRLHTMTRHRLGVPVQPIKFFEFLWKYLVEPGMGFFMHVYKDNVCLSSALFLHWNHTLIYKYSASSGLERQISPNDLLIWKAIQWGCEHGFTELDMGRTNKDQDGLRHFKRRWGSQESPLIYTIFSDTLPNELNGEMMKALNTAIRHSPTWVCRVTGEILYGHFG